MAGQRALNAMVAQIMTVPLDSERGASGAGRRWLGWAAAALFLAVAVASWSRLPTLEVDWRWLGAASLLVLASTGILAEEYRISAWLVGVDASRAESLRVTLLSSAANLLPLPGSLVVRTEALRRRGSGVGRALGSGLVMGLGWLGVALLLAGGLLIGAGSRAVAVSFLGSGTLVVGTTVWALIRLREGRGTLEATGRVLLIESVYVGVAAARLYAVLAGLGMVATLAQATALTVASALAAGVGLFPAGLGLRELLSGGLAPLVGLAPAVGAFASVVDRLIALLIRAVLAAAFLARR